MDKIMIHQKKAIELLKKGISVTDYEIEFDSEPVCAKDALLFGRNGIEVPDKLVLYDDEEINFDDMPSITAEDVKTHKINWLVSVEIPIEPEITNWINQQKIDLNELLGQLIKNFYNTMKTVKKNAAL